MPSLVDAHRHDQDSRWLLLMLVLVALSGRIRTPLLQYPAPSIFGTIADPFNWRHRSRLSLTSKRNMIHGWELCRRQSSHGYHLEMPTE